VVRVAFDKTLNSVPGSGIGGMMRKMKEGAPLNSETGSSRKVHVHSFTERDDQASSK